MTFGMLLLTLLTILGSMILGWLLRRHMLGGRCGRFGSQALLDQGDGVAVADDLDAERSAALDSSRSATAVGSNRQASAVTSATQGGDDRTAKTKAGASKAASEASVGSQSPSSGAAGRDALEGGSPANSKSSGSTGSRTGSDASSGAAIAGAAAHPSQSASASGRSGFGSADTSATDSAAEGDAAKRAELETSQAEIRRLNARLGRDDSSGVAAGTTLDEQLEASRSEAGSLRREVFARDAANEPEAENGDNGALSAEETEAQRLLESGEKAAPPANLLSAPESGRAPDDLTVIKGIGPRIQTQLNEHGIYYYDQIADFSGSDLAWADDTLGFKGRAVRDRWIAQAKGLKSGAGKPSPKSNASNSGSSARLNVLADAAGELDGLKKPDVDAQELSGDESEAMRLIDSGTFVADDSNRPAGLLDSASDGAKDDLKEIKGVGPKLENLLNSLGIFYFRQIAALNAMDVAWVDSKLSFRGRIVRDRWVDQAKRLS